MSKDKNIGSTMVEILIGFALLAILVVSFTKIISLSKNMVMESKDKIAMSEKLCESTYSGVPVSTSGKIYGLILDKTDDVQNDVCTSNSNYSGNEFSIMLNNAIVDTYNATVDGKTETISKFRYKED